MKKELREVHSQEYHLEDFNMNIILILGLISFGYLWAGNVSFLEKWKDLVGFGPNLRWKPTLINKFIHKQFNCYCITFWITLIVTLSIWQAFIVYVGAELITSIITYLKNKTTY